MTAEERRQAYGHIPPVYVVSGGVGASGELVAHTVLAQFPDAHVQVVVRPHVHEPEQVEAIVEEVAEAHGVIVHTLVHADLRRRMMSEAEAEFVPAIDLVGPLMERLSMALSTKPLGQPGLYRKLYNSYFRRVEAIEFTVAHDDGQRVAELDRAEIVLIGVSRVGKTPLSMYLSMQGWKVANVPMVPDVPPPDELLQVDLRRVVALTIEPQQLIIHRRWRQMHMGVSVSGYLDRERIVEELRAANHFYARHSFPQVDITDKPIETSADEVITAVSRRLETRIPVEA
jgi:[pyruvate, water dikinase]-phosphate phosphotransferase / [pyruvate, water dikinase] kinase